MRSPTFRVLWQCAALSVLTVAAGALTAKFHPKAPEWSVQAETAGEGEITVADALKLAESEQGVIWLDARRREAFEKEHIPGALPLNEAEWENLIEEAFSTIAEAPPEKPIIVYCDGQACEASRRVRDKLINDTPLGDRPLFILHGGWPAWQAVTGKQDR